MRQDLIEDIYQELHTELTATIDNELLCNIMESNGWIKVGIDCTTDTKYVEILEWIRSNIKGEHRGRYECWAFESEEDAILFKLTWG